MDALAWVLAALVLLTLAIDARGRARQRRMIVAALDRIEGVHRGEVRSNTWIGEGVINGVSTSIRVTIPGGCDKAPGIEGITWRRS